MTIKLNDFSVAITNFFESLIGGAKLTATNSFYVNEQTLFPDLEELTGLELTSCVITNSDGVRIPTQGLYTRVDSVTVTYDDFDRRYTANIVLA